MSEYRRFISYIYEYRKGRKENNCGYAKVEIRNGVCRLRVHLQPTGKSRGVLQVYGFVRDQGNILGVPLGNVSVRNQTYDFQTSGPTSGMGGTQYAIDDLRGIWLRDEGEENYITVWDDEPVATERFTVLPEPTQAGTRESARAEESGVTQANAGQQTGRAGTRETARAEESGIEQADAGQQQTGQAGTRETARAEESGIEQADAGQQLRTSQEGTLEAARPAETALSREDGAAQAGTDRADLRETETCRAQDVSGGNLWARWENFQKHYPHMQPFADEEITQCIGISLKDLSFLQREEWQLSRNPFVRQAYMRYRHLLLGCHRDGRFVLAVPGMDDTQEEYMARMCDFLYYKTADGAQQGTELRAADDTAAPEPTGYWYRFLNERCFL